MKEKIKELIDEFEDLEQHIQIPCDLAVRYCEFREKLLKLLEALLQNNFTVKDD